MFIVSLVQTSGSQPGCRGTLECHSQYSGVPRVETFFNISLKINFEIFIKPCTANCHRWPLDAANDISVCHNPEKVGIH